MCILPQSTLLALIPLWILGASCPASWMAAPAGRPVRVGVDRAADLHLMADHAEAYVLWTQRGLRHRTLLHVDGHLDIRPIAPENLKKIRDLVSRRDWRGLVRLSDYWSAAAEKLFDCSSFIYPALADDLVDRVVWLVPESLAVHAPAPAAERKWIDLVNTHLNAAVLTPASTRVARPGYFEANLFGKTLIVATLDELPPLAEPVLLDVDVDYFADELLSQGGPSKTDDRKRTSRLERFVDGLRKKGIRTQMVTIARSVDGGYTPLSDNYLADFLVALLRDPRDTSLRERLRAREALSLLLRDEPARLPARVGEALRENPGDPGLWYLLALGKHRVGAKEAFLEALARAVALDRAYALGYVYAAFNSLAGGVLADARRYLSLARRWLPRAGFNHLTLMEADLRYLEGRKEEAYRRYLRLAQEHRVVTVAAGRVRVTDTFLHWGMPAEARAKVKSYLEGGPQSLSLDGLVPVSLHLDAWNNVDYQSLGD